MIRSWLFVPADSQAKLDKAASAGADALILDLEDSVAAESKATARQMAADYLLARRASGSTQLWVRINPMSSPHALADLVAVVKARPDGILLPKPDSAADLVTLSHYLDALEANAGLPPGEIHIVPIASETAAALFAFGSYATTPLPRLAGLTWGAEDLAAAVGAGMNRHEDGSFTDLCRLARTLCLASAAAAGVVAVETVYPPFRDLDGLSRFAARAA
jgi:citrate lyase subunit beta/citryl-CoA lyase